jgi:hypothetical protein
MIRGGNRGDLRDDPDGSGEDRKDSSMVKIIRGKIGMMIRRMWRVIAVTGEVRCACST